MAAYHPHGSFTPAGYSGGSVEKYHYPLSHSSPSPEAVRLAVHGPRSLFPIKKEVFADLHLWLLVQGRYLMNAYSVFKVPGIMSLYYPVAEFF